MKNFKFMVILVVLIVCIFMMLTTADAQDDRLKNLAKRFVGVISRIQGFCIERGQVECEVIEMVESPPYLRQGQVIDYIGVRRKAVPYFFLVVAEGDEMDPDIYLFDSHGRVIGQGGNLTGPNDLAIHIPDYTQKVIERIKMYSGNGYIAAGVLAPVGTE
jgi:hypothetical protein